MPPSDISTAPLADSPTPENAPGSPPPGRPFCILPSKFCILLHHPLAQRLLFLLCLLVLVVPVYAPALDRFFAADQLVYFADLRNDPSLAAGLQRWDYNTSRLYDRGDELLFRPLFFAGLALENTFFGYHYRAWNITNLLLHLLVVYLLYELLRSIQPSLFAAVFALLFAVLSANIELVIWNHLGGYLLGYALILAALILARQASVVPHPARWLLAYAVIITVAMGFYEMAVVTALFVPIYLWFSLRHQPGFRLRPLLLASLIPLLLFALPYAVHLANGHRLLFTITHPGFQNTPLLLRVASLPGVWLLRLLNPWYADYSFRPLFRLTVLHVGNFDVLAQTTFITTLLALLGLFCLKPTPPFRPRTLPFAALLVTLLAAYAVLNSLGRDYAETNSYYVYFFALLGLVLLYSFLDFSRVPRHAQALALAILLAFIAANAYRTREISRDVGSISLVTDQYFDRIDAFVDQHRDEPGFSYAILDAPKKIDPDTKLWIGYSNATQPIVLPYSALLYLRYYNPIYPKYILEAGQFPTLRPPGSPPLAILHPPAPAHQT